MPLAICHRRRGGEAQGPHGCRPVLAFTCHTSMGSIAEMFQGRLEALQRQSEITDRKVAATIKHCHQLIAEQQAEEAKWAAEHPDLV
jgi:hypothetical protein